VTGFHMAKPEAAKKPKTITTTLRVGSL